MSINRERYHIALEITGNDHCKLTVVREVATTGLVDIENERAWNVSYSDGEIVLPPCEPGGIDRNSLGLHWHAGDRSDRGEPDN
jgi:hypothetical protein